MASLNSRLLVGATIIASIAVACDDPPSTSATEDMSVDGAVDFIAEDVDPDAAANCLSSNGCNAEPGFEGALCVMQVCVDCLSNAECQADPVYGAGTVCDVGRCRECNPGALDCECVAGACSEGICENGVCSECPRGALECPCNMDDTCDVGNRCDLAAGLCEVCPLSDEGCPCDTGGTCDAGSVCMMGLCAPDPCGPGLVDCPCDTGDVCDTGLACRADGFCRECNTDAPGCECVPAAGCSIGLICDLGTNECRDELTCVDVQPTCAANQLCDAGPAGVDASCAPFCAPGFVWNDVTMLCDANSMANCAMGDPDSILDQCTMQNRACDDSGVGARCASCLAGFVNDGAGNCRPLIVCADIQTTCDAENRTCAESDGVTTDASCEACVAPYADDGNGGCAITSSANCMDNDSLSIKPICDAENRECDDPGGATPPSCGACIAPLQENPATMLCETANLCTDLGCATLGRECLGQVPFQSCASCLPGLMALDPMDPLSQCLSSLTCADITCTPPEVCVESMAGGDAICVSTSCGANEAENSTGTCVSCSGTCGDAPGESMNWWPFTLQDDISCICETLPGWYFDTSSGFAPRECDADADGWVIEDAAPFISHPDAALANNARCSVRTIDRVTLRNELGQEEEVLLCQEGNKLASAGACIVSMVVDLYESKAQDSILEMNNNLTPFPAYGDRRPRPAEVNPLTKACIAGADWNHNGIADNDESQGMFPGVMLSPTQLAMLDFSYFAELHRSWWEERPANSAGTVVIAERSRCGADFPPGYDELSGSSYWRDCTRNRDADFDANVAQPGFDFGQWSCAAGTGSCPELSPPTTQMPMGFIPPHGLCDPAVALPPTDGVWRGMSHHSQFRCAEVVVSASATNEVTLTDVYDSLNPGPQPYAFNACGVTCPAGDPTCLVSDCTGSGPCATTSDVPIVSPNPASAMVECTRAFPTIGDVGLLSVRYVDDPAAYTEGCIDESVHWETELCPSGAGLSSDGIFNEFGKLACGCGANYGGLLCDIGCPNVMVDPLYSIAPRTGYWLCGESTTTSMTGANQSSLGPLLETTNAVGAWQLDSRIRLAPRERTPLCEDDTCGTGWEVR